MNSFLHFKRIRYRNFMAVGNEWISIDLNRNDMTLVTGHNGAGKTTIEEALVYVLFGKPHRKLKIDQIINVFNKGGLEVEVDFVRGGVPYKVIRGEKPKKFEIIRDGETIESKATVREYQKVLENILGMDRKLFTQLVVLEKNDFVPFMALQASDRRKIVENVLDIGVYSIMNKIAGDRVKECKQSLDNFDLDIRLKQKDIEGLETLIHELQQNTASQVVEKEARKASLLVSRDEKRQAVKEYAERAKPLVEALRESGIETLQLKERKFVEAEATLKANVQNEEKTINFFTQNPTCPTCSQEMAPDHVQSVVDKCQGVIDDINNKMEELEERKEVNDTNLAQAKDLERQLDEIKQMGLAMKSDHDSLQQQIDNIDAEIEKLKSNADVTERQKMLEDMKAEKDTMESKRADVEKRYDALRDIQISLKDDGAKAHVISQYMPIINGKLNEFLEFMNFDIAFQMNEKFEESFANPARADFVYHNLSNGQKSRVDFAILLSWLHVAEMKATASTNVLFIDEMLESFDPDGLEMLMRLLRDKFKDKNIFLISQRQDELSSHFRHEISFKLVNGYTVINNGE